MSNENNKEKPNRKGRKSDPDKPKRRHSKETIELMKERRRARVTQPRSGTSKKASSFGAQLLLDYKKHPNFPEIEKWIMENKHLLFNTVEETKEMGIETEYTQQYFKLREFCIGDLLFGEKAFSSYQEYDEIDYDTIEEDNYQDVDESENELEE